MIGYINNFLCLHQFSVIRIPVDVDVHVGALDCGQHQRVIILIQLCFVTVYYRGCLVIKTKKKKKKKEQKKNCFFYCYLPVGSSTNEAN